MNLYVLTLFVLCVHRSVGDLECGQINTKEHYNEKEKSRFEDYPWIGRLYAAADPALLKADDDPSEDRYVCTGNLITQRHLLTSVNYCAGEDWMLEYVVFGDADAVNATNESELKYAIATITIHPNYERSHKINDIGIVRLERDVSFNDYVQPICLPPIFSYTKDYTDKYLQVVGYTVNYNKYNKLRTVVHVVPTKICDANLILDLNINASLCATVVSENRLIAGAALMDVNSEDPNNKALYIVGTLTYGYEYYVFMKTALYINWIRSNIQYSLPEETAPFE